MNELEPSEYGLFVHQTFNGAMSSNGTKLEGFKKRDLIEYEPVYSGDIHVPQVCGPVTYVGSPYRVHFGDEFEPRVLILEDGQIHAELEYPTIKKHVFEISTVAELEGLPVREGDQIKIVVKQEYLDVLAWKLLQAEVIEWSEAAKVELHGCSITVEQAELEKIGDVIRTQIDYQAVFDAYCHREGIDTPVIHTGRTLMKKA
jgi:hypothetical protein